jgi:glycosyltransferase involved in cell wall biosynthesis
MRIAYVTAHHPPDFTSGATLQVERLARRAAELGHIVEVFSGAITMGLGDGELRTETVDGVVVHWIGTASRVEQGDDGNWDNPLATAAAERWLREFEPDVVHVHTLQTLGVGVVDVAADAGRRIVVTMHDLWWWCSRLFLVDTDLQPCPLVTDVGTCACAVTSPWRAERAARLATALDRVEQILTPSTVLRDVVIANGIDPERVAVDSNDIAIEVRPVVESPVPGSAVRFLYLGGDSALKGAGVLQAAASRLDRLAGWTLAAYGLSPDDPLPRQVRVAPAFRPEELTEVLASHDVLLIPSIARESFSIAAREALAAGLPVITSDCLGPEEVVRHGENGLVVPTGDAETLADAMRSLVDDPNLFAHLRHGVSATPVEVRGTDEHVEALLERYRRPGHVRTARTPNVAFVVGADGAIARYRVHHPNEALALHGATTRIVHYLDPGIGQIAEGVDVVVLQRVPATAHLLEVIDRWRTAGTLVVFDVDDLIVDPDIVGTIPGIQRLAPTDLERYVDGLHRYRTTLEHCDGAIVPTPALADSIGRLTGLPVAVASNGIGLVELRLAVAARARRPRRDLVTIAYFSGSDSHQPDLDLITPALAEVLRQRPDVEVLVVGPVTPGPALAEFGDRVTLRSFQRWNDLYDQLAAVDVSLAPLVLPSEFNEAKSAIKWLEAAAVGVPTVASASGPFGRAIDDGRTGVLCASTEDWTRALFALVDDPARRRRIGAAAQREVELHHGPHVTAASWTNALGDLAGRRPSDRTSTWTRRAPDERAASAPPLDAYGIDAAGLVRTRRRRRWFSRR